MFAQFIEGRVAQPESFRRQLDRWQDECAPGAVGWLGTTAGVTSDGDGFLAARFESAEAARANAERPEQSAWWADTEPLFEGQASFTDADDVALLRDGGSDEAGFVQVLRGRVNDPSALRTLFVEGLPDGRRPDVIGGVMAVQPDGEYTIVVYFTSEPEARAAEAQEAGSEETEEFERRMGEVHETPVRYLDLPDPWMWSAS